MKQRFLVRKQQDKSHIYCLTQKGSRDEIVKIGINEESPHEPLQVTSIYESPNSRLLILEHDPENTKYLFVLDEELRIIKIEDAEERSGKNSEKESKAKVISTVDLSQHQLVEELLIVEQTPFVSGLITSRMLKI